MTSSHNSAHSPSVAIIVPVYNGAKSIGACLSSLLAQTYPSALIDIIVVENGSTDGSAAVAVEYPVRVLYCDERGPAAARNVGIAHARAEIVAFTDADCVAAPDWLAQLVQAFADPEVGGVAGTVQGTRAGAEDWNLVQRFADQHATLRNFVSGRHEYLPHIYTANAAYRRTVLEAVNGFRREMLTGEDVDLSWRVQLAGYGVTFAPRALIYHEHRTTLTDLTRQFRQYGFGAVVLDTRYRQQPNYPRTRRFQLLSLVKQAAALARYVASFAWRCLRRALGRIDNDALAHPVLQFMIELSNISGKVEGLVATRLMTRMPILDTGDQARLVRRLYRGARSM
jgi:GT2 family glycosyltransferase